MSILEKFKSFGFLTPKEFESLPETGEEELYFVEMKKICEVVFTGLAASKTYGDLLSTPLPDDLSKVFCNIYAKVIKSGNGWSVGDIIPLQSFWGGNYRAITAWFNQTECGFSTSDQLSCINKNTANTAANIISQLEMHFDFFAME